MMVGWVIGRVVKFRADSIGRMEGLEKRGFDTIYGSDCEFCDTGKVSSVSVYSVVANTGAFSTGGCGWPSKVGWKGARMDSAKLGLLLNFCGATVGIDDSSRESESKVGVWVATAVG